MRKLVDRLSMKAVRRLVVGVMGVTVILIGVVLSLPLVPGPGFVAILAGLGILATEFVWARVLLKKVRARVRSAIDNVRGNNPAKTSSSNDPSSDGTSRISPTGDSRSGPNGAGRAQR